MRISVELVPRGAEDVLADARAAIAAMPGLAAFNVPDLTRFSLRSWEACALLRALCPCTIPHLRASDVPEGGVHALAEAIAAAGLAEVLVVRGDPAPEGRATHPTSSEALIRDLRRALPALRIHAGFDPYRHALEREMEGVARKLDAGADGFFTQPLFELDLLGRCADLLHGHDVFWGIAPVIGARSRAYWERTNKVAFPDGFEPTMDWNRAFAATALRRIRELRGNAYLMPIRVDLADYLRDLA